MRGENVVLINGVSTVVVSGLLIIARQLSSHLFYSSLTKSQRSTALSIACVRGQRQPTTDCQLGPSECSDLPLPP